MDEEGRPESWWARLIFPLFQQRQLSVLEWRLGLVVIGVALLFTWLIFWTFIPRLLGDMLVGMYNGVVWVVGLFSGGGATETASPVLTQVPSVLPSPSPSPLPSPSPSPFPR
jgi:hypothetical protein